MYVQICLSIVSFRDVQEESQVLKMGRKSAFVFAFRCDYKKVFIAQEDLGIWENSIKDFNWQLWIYSFSLT